MADKPKDRTCGSCVFYRGICQRYPQWVERRPNDTCGEYKRGA